MFVQRGYYFKRFSSSIRVTAPRDRAANNNNGCRRYWVRPRRSGNWIGTLQSSSLSWRTFSSSSAPATAARTSHINQEDDETTSTFSSRSATTTGRHSNNHMKRGYGRIVATCIEPFPHQTETSIELLEHKYPIHFVPVTVSSSSSKEEESVLTAPPSLVSISNYGGGMVAGDVQQLEFETNASNTTLVVLTQGANRIYSPYQKEVDDDDKSSDGHSPSNNVCQSNLKANVALGSTLIYAPDPTALYKNSSLEQTFDVLLEDQQLLNESGDKGKDTDDSTPAASCILIDWFSSGRGTYKQATTTKEVSSSEREEEEFWSQSLLSSKTSLSYQQHTAAAASAKNNDTNQTHPFLIESICLDKSSSMGFEFTNNNLEQETKFRAFATIILHGPTSEPCIQACRTLSQQFMKPFTRVRQPFGVYDTDEDENELFLKHLSGRVLMSINECSTTSGLSSSTSKSTNNTHVVRIVTHSNEDMYRVLHQCIGLPLKTPLKGYELYRERIHSMTLSAAPSSATLSSFHHNETSNHNKNKQQRKVITSTSSMISQDSVLLQTMRMRRPSSSSSPERTKNEQQMQQWMIYMLSDSGLPTGGFAFSAGFEAAHQLKFMSNNYNIERYISSSVSSMCQQQLPLICSGYELFDLYDNSTTAKGEEEFKSMYIQFDRCVDAILCTNTPSRNASFYQGEALLRVAHQWFDQSDTHGKLNVWNIMTTLQDCTMEQQSNERIGHIGPIFGILGASLGLSLSGVCHLYGYCMSRDILSSAVRLNCIGPLQSMQYLDKLNHVVDQSIVKLADRTTNEKEWRADIHHDNQYDASAAAVFEWLTYCSTNSPVTETIQPCHDMLSERLFRT